MHKEIQLSFKHIPGNFNLRFASSYLPTDFGVY